MKMKRYFAADARLAMRDLREEQGPDAVILSNRKVSGGVEIIAALDYEDSLVNASLGNPKSGNDAYAQAVSVEKNRQEYASEMHHDVDNENHELDMMHAENASTLDLGNIEQELKGLRNIMQAPMMQFAWGEMNRVKPLHASLLKQLMTLGLSAPLSQEIVAQVSKNGLHEHSWLEALKILARAIPVAKDNLLDHGGIVALVGPTGVGKTTTIAKLAARFAYRHGRQNIALVTTDSYRIGAHEQLRTYGRILGVPVQVASDKNELQTVLNHNKDRKLTLIDTAGISQRDVRLADQLSMLNISGKQIKKYLVLSATNQMNMQDDVIQSFKQARLNGCMLTKIDEAASLGEVLSVLVQHKLPVSYVSDGQKVPNDLHPARGKLLVREAVTLMQKSKKLLSDEQLAYMFGGMVGNASI